MEIQDPFLRFGLDLAYILEDLLRFALDGAYRYCRRRRDGSEDGKDLREAGRIPDRSVQRIVRAKEGVPEP